MVVLRRKNAKNNKRTTPSTDQFPLRQPAEFTCRGPTPTKSPSGGDVKALHTSKRKFSLSQAELGLRIRNELKGISIGPSLEARNLARPSTSTSLFTKDHKASGPPTHDKGNKGISRSQASTKESTRFTIQIPIFEYHNPIPNASSSKNSVPNLSADCQFRFMSAATSESLEAQFTANGSKLRLTTKPVAVFTGQHAKTRGGEQVNMEDYPPRFL